MYYLPATPNASGAYPGPRSNPEPGAWEITDEQAKLVVEYNGFVVISQAKDGTVTVEPDTAAWEAWKEAEASKEPSVLPDEPESDLSIWDELDSAYQEGVNAV